MNENVIDFSWISVGKMVKMGFKEYLLLDDSRMEDKPSTRR